MPVFDSGNKTLFRSGPACQLFLGHFGVLSLFLNYFSNGKSSGPNLEFGSFRAAYWAIFLIKMFDFLRNGFKDRGANFSTVFFEPNSGLNLEHRELYLKTGTRSSASLNIL